MITRTNPKTLVRLALVSALLVSVALGFGLTQLIYMDNSEVSTAAVDLNELGPPVRRAYEVAASHKDLFVHLPCYCGCAALSVPHTSLADCFLAADGGFAPHASACSTCVDIALDAERALSEGMDHAQIVALIDARYASRGPRTPTLAP